MACLASAAKLLLAVSGRGRSVIEFSVNASSASRGHQLLAISSIGKISNRRLRCAKASMLDSLPFYASGEIVRGFGRGSKELGIPTANYPLEVVASLPPALKTGVYYGWANVDNGEVYKMVMSIGWNPYYENEHKSMETHILHNFNRDLYGHLLKVCIAGYLRPEQNFKSLEELIAAIQNDISQAKELLDTDEEKKQLRDSEFFKEFNNNASQFGGQINC